MDSVTVVQVRAGDQIFVDLIGVVKQRLVGELHLTNSLSTFRRSCPMQDTLKYMEVIVDGMDEEGAYLGRTQYDAPEIDNTVIYGSDRELAPGDMIKVYINDAFDYDLVGRMEE